MAHVANRAGRARASVVLVLCGFLGSGAARAESSGQEVSASPFTPHIVNGVTTAAYPSVGVLGFMDNSGALLANCSGTLIGCNTLLTAAHCVCPEGADDAVSCLTAGPDNPADLVVFFQSGGFYRVDHIAVTPDYNLHVRGDVAVVTLLGPVTGITPSRINSVGSPQTGDPGTIVGFGGVGGTTQRPNPGAGVKRRGGVVVGQCFDENPAATHVCWSFAEPVGLPGQSSGTCYGDSGGPLFIDLGAGQAVAGVTSLVNSNCLPPATLYDTDIFQYRRWIETVGGDDLLNSQCGDLRPAGSSGTNVFSASGPLSQFNPSVRYTFPVADSTAVLRVALNGDVTGPDSPVSNSFGLYLKRGSPATESDFDCANNTGTTFGFCEVNAPMPGVWYVLVQWHRGVGTYQLTTSLFSNLQIPTPTVPAGMPPCPGDCTGDHMVDEAELLQMVGAALGAAKVSSCAAGEGHDSISVADLLLGVQHAQSGCPQN